jgi:hypothetical protein
MRGRDVPSRPSLAGPIPVNGAESMGLESGDCGMLAVPMPEAHAMVFLTSSARAPSVLSLVRRRSDASALTVMSGAVLEAES